MILFVTNHYTQSGSIMNPGKSFLNNRIRRYSVIFLLFLVSLQVKSQTLQDTLSSRKWTLHFQNTTITQYHPPFHAALSGANSLSNSQESPTSITSTLFLGARLWKGAECYINPELAGGSGFSKTLGIAGFPNGEVYRVDNPTPKFYVARFYLKQVFPLTGETLPVADDFNQVGSLMPKSYIAVYAGKFSIMDFFDCNQYSHDPRVQFYNWTLMGNGAWDYPANTRGYTKGVVVELVKPEWAVRFGTVMVPTTANGSVMDQKITRSNSEALEFEYGYRLGNQKGRVRVIGYFTEAGMGNYNQAIQAANDTKSTPNVDDFKALGHTKYGMGLNIEHTVSDNIGLFTRLGWNDGHNETWAFTEVDRHASLGASLSGKLWGRKDDTFGWALIGNGISKDHRDYLAAGGYGFIIGDGKLNYGIETISELYYSFKVPSYGMWITPDYQFILNPAYNQDRGPVHAFGLRMHIEL